MVSCPVEKYQPFLHKHTDLVHAKRKKERSKLSSWFIDGWSFRMLHHPHQPNQVDFLKSILLSGIISNLKIQFFFLDFLMTFSKLCLFLMIHLCDLRYKCFSVLQKGDSAFFHRKLFNQFIKKI